MWENSSDEEADAVADSESIEPSAECLAHVPPATEEIVWDRDFVLPSFNVPTFSVHASMFGSLESLAGDVAPDPPVAQPSFDDDAATWSDESTNSAQPTGAVFAGEVRLWQPDADSNSEFDFRAALEAPVSDAEFEWRSMSDPGEIVPAVVPEAPLPPGFFPVITRDMFDDHPAPIADLVLVDDETLPYDGSQCLVCLEETPTRPVACLECRKGIGCFECLLEWCRSEKQAHRLGSCPLCRGVWDATHPAVIEQTISTLLNADEKVD
ncbi:hypothetical protein M3Y99_00949000 [Aphelenchoides fujianensis]|nr:hypothetical protein M3Y99_00949000 [Aphelenchoides fujianensis]